MLTNIINFSQGTIYIEGLVQYWATKEFFLGENLDFLSVLSERASVSELADRQVQLVGQLGQIRWGEVGAMSRSGGENLAS